jgi:hypothetical protein
MVKQIIPLQHYLDVIPKHNFKDPDFKGVKFQDIFNEFVRLGIKGAKKRNNVLKDLLYYVQLGFFVRLHNETNKQPIFYQTHIGGDLVTDTGLREGLNFPKKLLDEHFKKINDEWDKLDKEKLFKKNRKTRHGNNIPTKKLERWLMLLDPVINITQNLMWTERTMDYDMLKDDYSKLIDDTIKELNKVAKRVHSVNWVDMKEENKKSVEAVFARFPFRITF